MLDLKTLTHETFADCLNQSFRIDLDGASALELKLFEVDARGSSDPEAQSRQPFSLLFRGPSETVLSQRLYRLHHEQIGEMEFFLVPIGPDRKGMRYEAVFN